MKIAATAALTALASLGTVGVAGAAFAGGVQVTPGYDSEVYVNESTTISYTACGWGEHGVADFILYFDPANTVYLGSGPTDGSFSFSYPTPGRYKIIVNCFIGEEGNVHDSAAFAYVNVVERPVETPPTTEPPTIPTTTAPPAPTVPSPAAPEVVVPTASPASQPAAGPTPVVAAAAAAQTPKATAALPATGASSTTTLLAAVAAAAVAVGESLRRLVRRSARAKG